MAAPVFSQPAKWMDPRVEAGRFEWVHLLERESEVRAQLGQPPLVADADPYRSWQYRFGEGLDHDDFSHALLFRKSDGALVSISRSYSEPRMADEWFPRAETKVYVLKVEGQAPFPMRVRRLGGGTLLLAPGSSEWGKPVQQVVLIHESVLARFYPALAEQAGGNK